MKNRNINNKINLEIKKGKIMKLKICLIIFFSFILLGVASQFVSASADEYKPYIHNPSVTEAPKLNIYGTYTTRLFPGSATYSHNIIVPRGTNKLQPSLSINYDSQSAIQRLGNLGAGWSLTQNYIQRDIDHTLSDTSDDSFILVLNGNPNKIVSRNGEFKTEIELYLRIENLTNAGLMYWIVTSKDGTQYRFGYNNDSLLLSNNGQEYIVKWSLDLIEDTHENKIYYSYLVDPFIEDSGAVYLSNISYNNDNLRLISFVYEGQTRPDKRLIYEQGNELEESRRLKDIYIYFDDSLIRRYSLDYIELNPEISLSSISNITYYGEDNFSISYSISFEYYGAQEGFDNSTGKWIMEEAFSSRETNKKDYGVRLIDVNNDGFVDVVKAREEGSSKYTKLNNKIDGWGSSSEFVMPVNIVRNIDEYNKDFDNGVRFGDINKDGLVDILHGIDSVKNVYINNGTGWVLNSSFNLPEPFVVDEYNDNGVVLADVNGDGALDILKAKSGASRKIYLNNGSGWAEDSNWTLLEDFVSSNKDTGLRIVNLNNDALPDLIYGGQPGKAWLNNGSGWAEEAAFAPNIDFVDYASERPDLGVRFADLNGDGLDDVLQNFYYNTSVLNETCYNETGIMENCTDYNITQETNTKINNGSGWIGGIGWISPEWFTYEGYNIGRRIADVNGDGYIDILVAYEDSQVENITHIRNSTNSYLLKEVKNEYGGLTEINYDRSTLKDNNQELGFNIWVVSNISSNNSLSGIFGTISNYYYDYSKGKYDYSESEFRGFNIVNETFSDNSIITHYFYQDSILKGKEYKKEIYDLLGKHYGDELNTYTYSSDNKIYLNSSSLQIYDGELIPDVINVSYEYDLYGNVIEMTNYGNVNVAGDEKFEKYDFIYNTSEYIVDKSSNYSLYDSEGSTLVRRSLYYYDGLTSAIDKGDITKIEHYNSLGDNPEINYSYDSYGNVANQTEPLGHITYYEYDASTNTYPIKTINHLGHTIDYNYDIGAGNILSEIRDGLTKYYSYDLFGRISNETISPDNLAYPTKIYTYSMDGIAPESIKVETLNNENNYSEEIYFYDGFSNLIQTKTMYDTNTQIIKNQFYDGKFRVYEEENPYFIEYSLGLDTSEKGSVTSYEYDALDRVVNLTKQDNNSVVIVFNKSEVTSYDENNNEKLYVLDAYGRIINIYEYNDESIHNTTYQYNPADNLIKIKDAEDNEFLFDYDSLGRKIIVDDPNMENWTYSYDLNGNLVNQTDGRGITTYLEYDSLNRLTFKYAGNSNITFVYDGQFNGTLTNITSDSNYFNIIYTRYVYDNRSRVIREEVFYCYREVDPGTDECEWVNVSKDYDSQDRIIKMYLPNTDLTYNYNKISKLGDIEGFLGSINYNAFGSMINKTYENNLVTEIDYDEINRISKLQTGTIQNLSYIYDNVSNVKIINDTKNSKAYTMEYDDLDRLIMVNISNLMTQVDDGFVYTYNSIGNLLGMASNNKVINYTYGELAHAPVIVIKNFTECGILDTPNALYTLEEDLSSGETCFIISADNITLDGQGHTISYAQEGSGYGVNSDGYNDLTIKNINIINNRNTSVDSPGVYLKNGYNNSVANVSLNILGETSAIAPAYNYGIYLYNINDSKIENSFVNTSNRYGRGILIESDSISQGDIIINSEIHTNEAYSDAILLFGVSNGSVNNTLISNVKITTTHGESPGISIFGGIGEGSGKTYISNSSIETAHSSSCGIYLTFVEDVCEISDTDISAENKEDICLASGDTKEYYFTNVTYSDESVFSGKLYRKWYLNVKVNDTNGNNVEQANVTAWNVSEAFQFSELTDPNGEIETQELIEYVNDAGTKTYYSNYTLNATKENYETASQSVNLTTNLNLIFTLEFSALPNDTSKFYIKNSSQDNVAWFGNEGNIVLKGICNVLSDCLVASENLFAIGNSTDDTTAYVNSTGDLCIEKGACSSSASCTEKNAFKIRNSTQEIVSYIDFNGELCFTGGLYENVEL